MIIRVAANEQEIEQSLEVYIAADPPRDLSYKATVLTHWLGLYANCPDGFWVAEDETTGHQIVGVASAVRMPPQWILSNFYVLPAYHGKGIGKKLLEEVYSSHEGCERFLVHASEHPSAISLYMQCGMYPLPHSMFFTGNPEHIARSTALSVMSYPVDEILPTLNTLDLQALGFHRSPYHQRWGKDGRYFLVKQEDQVVAYFRISPGGSIGPLVASSERWIPATLDWAIDRQKEMYPGDLGVFVPGANRAAIAHLLARGFRYLGFNLLFSSHPMPGLAQVVFHDTDLL